MTGNILESGYEADRLTGQPDAYRWWIYLHIPSGRPQEPRRGVPDAGFRFARGGRATSPQEAAYRLDLARGEANAEWAFWTHQPSHLLGPDGSLIPLGTQVALEAS